MTPRRSAIITCSVIIALSIMIGLGTWGIIKGQLYKAVVGAVIFLTVGAFIFYHGVFEALRSGHTSINAKAGISSYSRDQNPVGYWFYLFLFLIGSCLVFGEGINFLLHSVMTSK